MRANVLRLSAQWDSAARQLQGCNSLEIVTVGARSFIIAAGEADGGLSSYEIMADGSLVPVDDILRTANSGTTSVRNLASYSVDGVSYVIPAGRYDDNMTVYRVEGDGTLTSRARYTIADGAFNNLVATCGFDTGSGTFVYSVNAQGGGIGISQLNADGTLGNITFMADNASRYLNDVSAMCHAILHGKSFMFAASTFDAGLQSFEIAANGTLDARFQLDDDAVGFFNPAAMVAVQNGPRAFLVMGAAGTDELVVLRVSAGGKMKVVDRLVDTNETRFESVSVMKAFEHNGRSLILAGGGDDGFSIFELDYRGRLHLVATIADDFDTTLDNIADLEIVEIGGRIYIFAASPTDHGFTQFELVLAPGQVIEGGRGPQDLVGTAGDDVINGYGGRDMLDGGAGDDILIDGRGKDFLTGGDGADIFRFHNDGKKDVIMDYEPGLDKIDLSDYPMLYSFNDITILPRTDGALLRFRGEELRIYSDDGSRLEIGDFQPDDFIFL